ncbi:hypothetical protein ACFX13_038516 [Malus domestica]|uniref:Uncharacterized protein n=1 Tax=Malus domestica TaxID=3750 RepID=A0A498JTT8_MALDO|nr:hypothetical protein DVH24_035902 [Malus domestica]
MAQASGTASSPTTNSSTSSSPMMTLSMGHLRHLLLLRCFVIAMVVALKLLILALPSACLLINWVIFTMTASQSQ